MTSSYVDVTKSLAIVTGTKGPDRELFDLESDDGPARVVISTDARVLLDGIWGLLSNSIQLNSVDIPYSGMSHLHLAKFINIL